MNPPYASFGIKLLDPAGMMALPNSKTYRISSLEPSTINGEDVSSHSQGGVSTVKNERFLSETDRMLEQSYEGVGHHQMYKGEDHHSCAQEYFQAVAEEDFHLQSVEHIPWRRDHFLWDSDNMVALSLPPSHENFSGMQCDNGSQPDSEEECMEDARPELFVDQFPDEIIPHLGPVPSSAKGGRHLVEGNGCGLVTTSKYGVRADSQVPAGKLGKVCRVPDCPTLDLTGASNYCVRHRICQHHVKSLRVEFDGVPRRFCQKCTRFHTLEEFDGTKRTCRKGLKSQKRRRLLKNAKLEEGECGVGANVLTAALKDSDSFLPHVTCFAEAAAASSSATVSTSGLSCSSLDHFPTPATASSAPAPTPLPNLSIPISPSFVTPDPMTSADSLYAAPCGLPSFAENHVALALERKVAELAATLRQVQGQIAGQRHSFREQHPFRDVLAHGSLVSQTDVCTAIQPSNMQAVATVPHAHMMEADFQAARAEAEVASAQAEAAGAQARLNADLLLLARRQVEFNNESGMAAAGIASAQIPPPSAFLHHIYNQSVSSSEGQQAIGELGEESNIHSDVDMADNLNCSSSDPRRLLDNLIDPCISCKSGVTIPETASFLAAKQLLERTQEFASQGPLLTADSKVSLMTIMIKFLNSSPETLPANLSEGLKTWISTQPSWTSSDIRPGCVEVTAEYVIDKDHLKVLEARGVEGIARSLLSSSLAEYLASARIRIKAFHEWLPVELGKVGLPAHKLPEKDASFEFQRTEPTCLCSSVPSTLNIYGRFPVGTEVLVRMKAANAFPIIRVQGPETIAGASTVWGPNVLVVTFPPTLLTGILFIEVRHKGVEKFSTVLLCQNKKLVAELQLAERALVARAERNGYEVWNSEGSKFLHLCFLIGITLSWKYSEARAVDPRVLLPSLQFASGNGLVETTKCLLDVARICKTSFSRNVFDQVSSPLYEAIRFNATGTVALLLSCGMPEIVGCPFSVEAHSGMTPLQLAVVNPEAIEIWELLTDTYLGSILALSIHEHIVSNPEAATLCNCRQFLSFVRLKLESALSLVQHLVHKKLEDGCNDTELILEEVLEDLIMAMKYEGHGVKSVGVMKLMVDFIKVALSNLGEGMEDTNLLLLVLDLEDSTHQEPELGHLEEPYFEECCSIHDNDSDGLPCKRLCQAFGQAIGLFDEGSNVGLAEHKEERLLRNSRWSLLSSTVASMRNLYVA